MQKAMPVINNFIMGEVSPRVEGRVELPQYAQSCRILENFIIAPQGGADRRPGSYFVANGKNDSDRIRLLPLALESGNYVLELGHQYIRFFKDHERIEYTGTPVEAATTYDKSDLFQIKYVQTKDTLYSVHRGYDPKELTRGGDDYTWTFQNVTFTGAGAPDFSAAAGTPPGCISLFEQRMVLAGATSLPNRIWLSKSLATRLKSGSGGSDT